MDLFLDSVPAPVHGYRVHGVYDPHTGLRFNLHQLLLDPYARALTGEVQWSNACYGFDLVHPDEDLSFCTKDSAAFVPKCVVTGMLNNGTGVLPGRAWEDTTIYEVHIRGLTIQHPAIDEMDRGTFAGLRHPALVAYLWALGVTAVELLPVHSFVHDHFLDRKGLRNFWGYSPTGFFVPHNEYTGRGGPGEVLRTRARTA